MNTWFTVKVKYTKQLENGEFKKVSEPYLLAAMTFTDAEARIYEELGSLIRGEFSVTNIARTDFHDIFHYEDSFTWYKVKVAYESMDADSEKKKKISQNFLVSASSVKEAYERIHDSLSTMLVDFVVPSITLSPIVDIFPFNDIENDKEISRKSITNVLDEIEEPVVNGKGVVFSAGGSDIDDEENYSDIVDEFSTEEE